MGRPSLVLYLDVVSPFAYLAFHIVRVSKPNSLYFDKSSQQQFDLSVTSVWDFMSIIVFITTLECWVSL